MTPRMPPRTNDRGRGREREHRALRAQLEDARIRLERAESQLGDLTERLERTEYRLLLLDTTLQAVARRTSVSIGCACDHCDRSYLLITDGMLVCPNCNSRQSI
ncbi:hypothetical protein GS429_04125 [Natronorubrum sp. JWXQ-INN-674]|uniref:Uncharacterized protein n=1 Tax=Natronorubrum halalkaliphilum TaxID=2691917 RepID=A0A6B0VKE9_9EURY|nr:hypothetical protein [Natronorubrum halalkaliphilum]MXV61262.1 hypothetical protein [Natronorubrum halalkaliphilum]